MDLSPEAHARERPAADVGRERAHELELGLAHRDREQGLDEEQVGQTLLAREVDAGLQARRLDLEALAPLLKQTRDLVGW